MFQQQKDISGIANTDAGKLTVTELAPSGNDGFLIGEITFACFRKANGDDVRLEFHR